MGNKKRKNDKGKLFIGASGWNYAHWKEGVFYPKNLPVAKELEYYAWQFRTVELNFSFYRLPAPTTYQKWRQETPAGFMMSLKVSRFITHIKRLSGVKAAWDKFLKRALLLKEKLGPFLFQFPPNFRAESKNIRRLDNFLEYLRRKTNKAPETKVSKLRYAFEFRHQSWCSQNIYGLLKKYKAAWVIADSPDYPRADAVTADFVYIRMHGSRLLFSSKYTKEELWDLARKIKKWQSQGLDIYCYFNNDAQGFAVKNVKRLLSILKE